MPLNMAFRAAFEPTLDRRAVVEYLAKQWKLAPGLKGADKELRIDNRSSQKPIIT